VGDFLVQNLTHRQGEDGRTALAEEGVDVSQGVAGVVERDEEAFGAILAGYERFEGVDVGPTGLVLLLDLDRVPVVEELREDGRLAFGDRVHDWRGGHGEDTDVDAHVADLRLVGNTAQGDDGPVLELERRNRPQLLLGPGRAIASKFLC